MLSVLLAGAALALWKLVQMLAGRHRSGIANLPGPPSASWIFGNLRQVMDAEHSVLHERWVEEYGPHIMYKGMFGSHRLMTFDTRALNHVLTHSAQYQKPEQTRRNLGRALGNGVLITEGEQHRQQRRVMNPAFGPAQIRELTEIFVQKSIELRDVWAVEIEREAEKGFARINVLQGLTRATLDVIGLAGFNYAFDTLSGKDTELSRALQTILHTPAEITPMMFARMQFPILNTLFPSKRAREVDAAQEVMRRIGRGLIAEKKAAIRAEMAEKHLGMARRDVVGRDLLTLLIKANMATDIPDGQRLADEDVLAQVPTFIVAGHETTSVATTWALFALTQAPEVQRKLREELRAVGTDAPTMDELGALPYLDAVVRETLRLHAPVPGTIRVATAEDVIPIGAPFVDRFGVTQDHIRVSKGTEIVIPILSINRAEELWGADAREFRPERWAAPLPEAVAGIPGVWAHTMTFIAGPRACIGYRFSLVEMKALLFTLVRAFEFELAVPCAEILKKASVVQRPVLRSAPGEGSQMLMRVRACRAA